MKTDQQYLEEHLGSLAKLGRKTRQVMDGEYNTFGSWTPLKLIVLKNYVDVYTKILFKKRLKRIPGRFRSTIFVDVFSGSGLNKIKYSPNRKARDTELQAWFPGSTIIAAEYASASSKFDEIIAIDNDAKKLQDLNLRMKSLSPTQAFTPLCGDAEDQLQSAVAKISEEKAHYLAFVDYEDIKSLRLDVLDSLLQERGDIFITILASGILRCFGKSLESDKDRGTLRRFLTDQVFEALEEKSLNGKLEISDIAKGVANKLHEHKDIVEWIPIRKGSTGYQYLMFFAVSRTGGGSPFVNMISGTKDRMSGITGDDVARVLPIVSGVQRQIC
jgi:three-Cys-motif partner protein